MPIPMDTSLSEHGEVPEQPPPAPPPAAPEVRPSAPPVSSDPVVQSVASNVRGSSSVPVQGSAPASSIGRIVAGIFEGFEDALSPDRLPNLELSRSPDFMSIASGSSGKTIDPDVLLNSEAYVPHGGMFPATAQSGGSHPGVGLEVTNPEGAAQSRPDSDAKLKVMISDSRNSLLDRALNSKESLDRIVRLYELNTSKNRGVGRHVQQRTAESSNILEVCTPENEVFTSQVVSFSSKDKNSFFRIVSQLVFHSEVYWELIRTITFSVLHHNPKHADISYLELVRAESGRNFRSIEDRLKSLASASDDANVGYAELCILQGIQGLNLPTIELYRADAEDVCEFVDVIGNPNAPRVRLLFRNGFLNLLTPHSGRTSTRVLDKMRKLHGHEQDVSAIAESAPCSEVENSDSEEERREFERAKKKFEAHQRAKKARQAEQAKSKLRSKQAVLPAGVKKAGKSHSPRSRTPSPSPSRSSAASSFSPGKSKLLNAVKGKEVQDFKAFDISRNFSLQKCLAFEDQVDFFCDELAQAYPFFDLGKSYARKIAKQSQVIATQYRTTEVKVRSKFEVSKEDLPEFSEEEIAVENRIFPTLKRAVPVFIQKKWKLVCKHGFENLLIDPKVLGAVGFQDSESTTGTEDSWSSRNRTADEPSDSWKCRNLYNSVGLFVAMRLELFTNSPSERESVEKSLLNPVVPKAIDDIVQAVDAWVETLTIAYAFSSSAKGFQYLPSANELLKTFLTMMQPALDASERLRFEKLRFEADNECSSLQRDDYQLLIKFINFVFQKFQHILADSNYGKDLKARLANPADQTPNPTAPNPTSTPFADYYPSFPTLSANAKKKARRAAREKAEVEAAEVAKAEEVARAAGKKGDKGKGKGKDGKGKGGKDQDAGGKAEGWQPLPCGFGTAKGCKGHTCPDRDKHFFHPALCIPCGSTKHWMRDCPNRGPPGTEYPHHKNGPSHDLHKFRYAGLFGRAAVVLQQSEPAATARRALFVEEDPEDLVASRPEAAPDRVSSRPVFVPDPTVASEE